MKARIEIGISQARGFNEIIKDRGFLRLFDNELIQSASNFFEINSEEMFCDFMHELEDNNIEHSIIQNDFN